MIKELLTRKRIIIGFSFVLLILLINLCLTHSILTLRGVGNEEKIVHMQSGSNEKEFTLSNNSKMLLVRKGDYSINVTSNDKSSIYHQKIGGFSKKSVDLEVRSQKKSIGLGENKLDCAVDKEEASLVVYYPCTPLNNTSLIPRPYGGQSVTNKPDSPDPLADFFRSNSSGNASEKELSVTLKPYKSGFIKAASLGNSLRIFAIDAQGESIEDSLVKFEEFTGIANDESFSASGDGTSGTYAIFDQGKKSLLLFAGSSKEPTNIDLSNTVFTGEDYQYKVYASSKFVFIVNSLALDGHEDTDKNKKQPTRQKLVVIDIANKKVVKENDLPKGFLSRRAAVSPDGKLLIIDEANKNKTYVADGVKKLQELPAFEPQKTSICWKDNDSFYYTDEARRSIYLFGLKENASFLAYQNNSSQIVGINCAFGQLTFTLSPRQPDKEELNHFILSNQDLNSQRPETILPLSLVGSVDLLYASLFKETVLVKMVNTEVYDNRNNPNYSPVQSAGPDEQAKQRVLEYFKSKGLETDSLKFNFFY